MIQIVQDMMIKREIQLINSNKKQEDDVQNSKNHNNSSQSSDNFMNKNKHKVQIPESIKFSMYQCLLIYFFEISSSLICFLKYSQNNIYNIYKEGKEFLYTETDVSELINFVEYQDELSQEPSVSQESIDRLSNMKYFKKIK